MFCIIDILKGNKISHFSVIGNAEDRNKRTQMNSNKKYLDLKVQDSKN